MVRERHLRDLELLELQHAPEDVRGLRGDVVQLDALGLDRPVTQGKRAVVGTAGKCQTQLAHPLLLAGMSHAVALPESCQAGRLSPAFYMQDVLAGAFGIA